jgi:hypothetical protein
MRNRWHAVLTSFWILAASLALPGQTQPCSDVEKYEMKGGFCLEMKPLVVNRVAGRAVIEDPYGNVLPDDNPRGGCLSLFTVDPHKFVASTVVDQHGRFDFGPILPGRYRLLARLPGFPLGNDAVTVVRSVWPRRRRILVLFTCCGIDVCSSADYDRK